MWWQQYKKELLGHRGEFLLIAGALVLWTLFLLSRVGIWSPVSIVAVYTFPAGFLPLWTLWTSVHLYRHEWRENTSYLMLSLPARGWTIASAKLAVLLTGVLGFSLLMAAGGWLLTARAGLFTRLREIGFFSAVPMEWVIKMVLLGFAGMIASLTVMGLLAQFAFVFSRLFSRFQGLAMVWTWVLSVWLMGRFGDIGGRLLAWLPDFHLRILHPAEGFPEFHVVTIESGPFWALALCALGLFALLHLILERAVEV